MRGRGFSLLGWLGLLGWLSLLGVLSLLGGLMLLGCDERPVDGPFITQVTPASAAPGEVIDIEGQGFGLDGHVAIGGRPLVAASRGDRRITLTLPMDLAPGETLVVVFAGGRPSPPYPLDVRGEPGAPDRPHAFPPDFQSHDGGPPRDGGPTDRGMGPDIGGPDDLVARFSPDPSGAQSVALEALPSAAGELRLAVRVPGDARGVALHLAYDRGLLRFVEAQPRGGRLFATGEIGPGRLALGRVFGGRAGDEATTVLRFALVGPGEGRVDLPTRRLAVRDGMNRPIVSTSAGGGLRVERLP